MKNTMALILLLFGMLLSQLALASYRSEGWHWYSPTRDIFADKAKEIVPPKPATQSSAKARLKAFQAYYDELQAEAVLAPTPEKLAKVAELEQYMYLKSKQYANAKQEALLMYPNLSHDLKFPTQEKAQHIYKTLESEQAKRAVKHLAQDYGLFFFYKGSDLYVKDMARTIARFAKTYQFSLFGISLDGVLLPEIKKHLPEKGQLQRFNIKALPALVLAHPKTKQVRVLSYGYVTEGQLLERCDNFATHYRNKEIE